jgi:hypothetical protein
LVNVTAASSSFIMQCASCGTPSEVVNAKKDPGESEVAFDFKEMFSAVRQLDLHHFLELENVIIPNRNVAKVPDFGLAGTFYSSLMHTSVGAPSF